MSFRCSVLHRHKWSRWRRVKRTTNHQVVSHLFGRMPEHDFTTTELMQVRECERCGLTQQRNP